MSQDTSAVDSSKYGPLLQVLPHLRQHISRALDEPWNSSDSYELNEELMAVPYPVRDVLVIECLRSVLPIWEQFVTDNRDLHTACREMLLFAIDKRTDRYPAMIKAVNAAASSAERFAALKGGLGGRALGRLGTAVAELDIFELSRRSLIYENKSTIFQHCAEAVYDFTVSDSRFAPQSGDLGMAQWHWIQEAYYNARQAWSFGTSIQGWYPKWNSSTAVALAKGIFSELAFDRMPILADALQDADCDHEGVLTHLRSPNSTFTRADFCLWHTMGLKAEFSPAEIV